MAAVTQLALITGNMFAQYGNVLYREDRLEAPYIWTTALHWNRRLRSRFYTL